MEKEREEAPAPVEHLTEATEDSNAEHLATWLPLDEGQGKIYCSQETGRGTSGALQEPTIEATLPSTTSLSESPATEGHTTLTAVASQSAKPSGTVPTSDLGTVPSPACTDTTRPANGTVPFHSRSLGTIPSHQPGTVPHAAHSNHQNASPPQQPAVDPVHTLARGLAYPTINSGERVSGHNKRKHRLENKRRRLLLQSEQPTPSYWTKHQGHFTAKLTQDVEQTPWIGDMCPRGLALNHPAAPTLLQYATHGCPSNTGRPWTRQQMEAAIRRGPHPSALEPAAITQHLADVEEKVLNKQAKVILWDDIKDNPPHLLKISPLAMIPHKSRAYRAILDLSFELRLRPGKTIPSVNGTTTLSGPTAATDQFGQALARIIHAVAETADHEKIFMAKYDIKDGFWRLQCARDDEWNFAYVLPQLPGAPTKLVIPNSLQMGWVESPTYFCAASETARDVATQYIEHPVGTIPDHPFAHLAMTSDSINTIRPDSSGSFKYLMEVYVDDFIPMASPTTKEQLRHIASAVMHGIHDVFPPAQTAADDPISAKKLAKLEGQWALRKDILGFTFDGECKTMILEEPKRRFLIDTLRRWTRTSSKGCTGIPFAEFLSVTQKIRHAFTAIPAGKGLLTPCNAIVRKRPAFIWLARNKPLRQAIQDCRTLLRESSSTPTTCRELVLGNSHYVGVKDASIEGVGGIIIGDTCACVPTVFRLPWPEDIKQQVRKTNAGQGGTLTNSDLEMAGLLLLFLVMEEVCTFEAGAHIALFSDNSPTVSWVRRLAAKGSLVAGELLRALSLRLKLRRVSPLTPLHIKGDNNSMTDIPSRSFGSVPKWHCETDAAFLTLFNSHFPLPQQNSWTVFRLSTKLSMRVISVLRMQAFTLDEWRRLPGPGRHVGKTGVPMSNLFEWTLTFRTSTTPPKSDVSRGSQPASDKEDMVQAALSKGTLWRRRFQPLARRSLWPVMPTQPKSPDLSASFLASRKPSTHGAKSMAQS